MRVWQPLPALPILRSHAFFSLTRNAFRLSRPGWEDCQRLDVSHQHGDATNIFVHPWILRTLDDQLLNKICCMGLSNARN
jgi:hypothetical protein